MSNTKVPEAEGIRGWVWVLVRAGCQTEMGEGWKRGWGLSGKMAQFKGKRSRETPKL